MAGMRWGLRLFAACGTNSRLVAKRGLSMLTMLTAVVCLLFMATAAYPFSNASYPPRTTDWGIPASSWYISDTAKRIAGLHEFGDVELGTLICESMSNNGFVYWFYEFQHITQWCDGTEWKKAITCIRSDGVLHAPVSMEVQHLCPTSNGGEFDKTTCPPCSISSNTPVRDWNLGYPSCPDIAGNPLSPASGNKYQKETDFDDPDGLLSFARHYTRVAPGAIWPEAGTIHSRGPYRSPIIKARASCGYGVRTDSPYISISQTTSGTNSHPGAVDILSKFSAKIHNETDGDT